MADNRARQSVDKKTQKQMRKTRREMQIIGQHCQKIERQKKKKRTKRERQIIGKHSPEIGRPKKMKRTRREIQKLGQHNKLELLTKKL